VVAAEVADGDVRPAVARGRAAVDVASTVPLSAWASALVDDADAAPVVTAAVAALAVLAAGADDDAQFALDEAEAYELGWHGIQELRFLDG
jgi:hypothetical protein